ncbi:MAG TPA: nucleotidyltransferase family protein [Candidatus Bathyarchaeia archaeon]|nr:nucleotidyltransferase family protein [Candidatus Bathyarchaeia archaeon]
MGDVKGLVLCGGPGTRLRPITYYFNKALIPIGLKQKPLLEYVVRLLKFHGVDDLAFLVDYKAEQIVNYFDNGSRFDVKISYIRDMPELKGTAGSVLNAFKQGFASPSDTLLVYYGDIVTTMDLKKLLDFHRLKKAVATIALASGFTVRVGLADVDSDSKLLGFEEKPKLDKPVSIGIMVLESETLKTIEALFPKKRGVDLMGDVVPNLVQSGAPIYGYLSDAFWYDVGSTEAYEKLDHQFLEKSLDFLFKK